MTDRIIVEATTNDDGKLVIDDLPPKSKFRVIIEEVLDTIDHDDLHDPELEKLLTDEALQGEGLTTEEISRSPEIGLWKNKPDITDSAEYAEHLRHSARGNRSV